MMLFVLSVILSSQRAVRLLLHQEATDENFFFVDQKTLYLFLNFILEKLSCLSEQSPILTSRTMYE